MRTFLILMSLALLGCPTQRSYSDGSGPDSFVDTPDLDDDDSAAVDDDASDDDDAVSDDDDAVDDDDTAADDDDATPIDDGPTGWIGSPCDTDSDCAFDGGTCFQDGDGFPRGTCTQACELYCPDESGHPVTFCTADADLPATAPYIGDGGCLSRCDFSIFPDSGCRPDYGCRVVERANESWTENYVCLPGAQTDLTQCQLDLAARGIAFEPTIRAIDHPVGQPNLDCLIEAPVWVQSPVLGVELRTSAGVETERVLAGCAMAHALGDTVEDVLPWSVEAIRHMGTYNCRVIGTSTTLSEHALANAIDIYGFDFYDGSLWTLVDDWEHDTTSFTTDAAEWLYDTAYRWHDNDIWNIILTPNFNAPHDNHFHVDLTPNASSIGLLPPDPNHPWGHDTWIGPAPYSD